MAPTCCAGPRDVTDGNGYGGGTPHPRGQYVNQDKIEMRRLLKERRRAIGDERGHWSRLAAWRVIPFLPSEQGGCVSLFWSIGDEIDTAALRTVIHALGLSLALPRVISRGTPLALHHWTPGEELVAGPMGLSEPRSDARLVQPDVVIVPFLGIDTDGYRLGYGGGFYDATLASLRSVDPHILAIGFGFECQVVDKVPREPQDERVDMIVTNAQVRRVK